MFGPEAFLSLVIEQPDDDGPRLVFADWLSERPEPAFQARGRFIRVQLALARLPADDPRRPTLIDGERALLAAWRAEWEAPLRGLVTGQQFRRGFAEEVTVEAGKLLARGKELFALAPVRHARLIDAVPYLSDLVASPLLARLRGLTIYAHHIGDPLARVLAGSPHLGKLQALHLARNQLTDAGAAALAGAERLAGLTTLTLRENHVGETGARALAASPALGRLATLDLGINLAGPGGAAALAGSTRLGRLTTLELRRNRVGDEGIPLVAAALAAAGARVRTLGLADNGLTADGLGCLAGSPGLLGLHHLDLGENTLGDAAASALAACPHLAGLRGLGLRRARLTDAAVAALAASPHLAGLRHLDLRENEFGHAGVQALIDAPHFRRLTHLVLSRVLTPRQESLLRKRYGPHLRLRAG